jgi:hypothetical protein
MFLLMGTPFCLFSPDTPSGATGERFAHFRGSRVSTHGNGFRLFQPFAAQRESTVGLDGSS